jgi:hypothetical protein
MVDAGETRRTIASRLHDMGQMRTLDGLLALTR